MKNTFGTIGLGLAGAVAAVGLMSAGVQTAQAEFTIDSATAGFPVTPTITVDPSNSALYDWTYAVSLDGTNPAASGSYFYFGLASDSQETGYSFNLTGGVGTVQVNSGGGYVTDPNQSGGGVWSIYENTSNYYAKAVYNGSTSLAIGSVGSFTVISSVGFHGTITSNTLFNAENTTYPFSITPGAAGTDFASIVENPANTVAAIGAESVVIPSLNGSIPESPLPLPAAFWPGLLTLGGMAVVGGLSLRRRTV